MPRIIKLKSIWRLAVLVTLSFSALRLYLNLPNQKAPRLTDGEYLEGDSKRWSDRRDVSKHFLSGDVARVLFHGKKVNNVAESIRKKHIFQQAPKLLVDLSKNYVNKVFLSKRRDGELFSPNINQMSPYEVISHINAYRHEIRQTGRKMDIFDKQTVRRPGRKLRDWELWYLNMSQYELYRHDDPIIDQLLQNMASLPIVHSYQLSGGTQLKLDLTFSDDSQSLWKPMRFTRETETLENHYYFSDYERHTAEIAAFHLDRILGMRRAPPVVGRIVNITSDIRPYASVKFLKTIFRSPVGNLCFYGKCSYYCDSGHAICGHPDWVEGSAAAFLPDEEFAPRYDRRNPWRRSYSRSKRVQWEDDPNYCQEVKATIPFDKGRSLLDLMDLHVFDFIQGNMDRHHYEIFDFPDKWQNDTVPILLDNGRGWGKMYWDELSILTPLMQCCQIRHSTLQKLLLLDEGPYKLSELLNYSTAQDPLYPILVEGHLIAADRRVRIALNEIQKCIVKSGWSHVVIDDGF